MPNLRVCGSPITLSPEMSYLGMTIDKSMLFKTQFRNASAKAERITTKLARILPNVGGPREDRRHLSSVMHSVLLYGTPSWACTLDLIPANVSQLNRPQRKVLIRSICGYRTISEAASNVIRSTPPADLLPREREAQFEKRRFGRHGQEGIEPKKRTLSAWQERWDSGSSGQWTRRLIPNVTQ
ncbi:uncharacterized protein LOC112603056 [Melanaphis sacchari]|uniref:uncharacterized protein LOC112603056 n=1 Tax=Melanaphis sacchari TaxID=742174 RepID=UPI000DC13329|nr:uncharacterized protein LOC112603056 [Melanaphis sacchari]